jgi:hypothetical protein
MKPSTSPTREPASEQHENRNGSNIVALLKYLGFYWSTPDKTTVARGQAPQCWTERPDHLSFLRFNPIIRTFYQRLQRAGDAKKVALTVCMRKLLIILNAMLKHRIPWRYEEAQHA